VLAWFNFCWEGGREEKHAVEHVAAANIFWEEEGSPSLSSLYLLLLIFGLPQNKMRKYNIYIYIGVRKGCWNTEKGQNWLKRFKNTKGENLAVYFWQIRALFTKKIQVGEEKSKNQMFMDSIKFYPRFNWIYRGFDCKKIDFVSQFRLLSEEIKVMGSNCNFKELIWSN